MDLLSNVCTASRYVIWWQIADKFHFLISECEIMVKILCHASLLRVDDVRLKSLPIATRLCAQCDHSAIDDANHLVMQCPGTQPMRNDLFNELKNLDGGHGKTLLESNVNIFWVLMGKPCEGIPDSSMVSIWITAARHISRMYKWKLKQGIG